MKNSDIIKANAIAFTSGKLLASYTLSDMTKVSETKNAILYKIPKSYEGKKIIINIHNITGGTYKTYIVKNPNLNFDSLKERNKKKLLKKPTKKKNAKKRLK